MSLSDFGVVLGAWMAIQAVIETIRYALNKPCRDQNRELEEAREACVRAKDQCEKVHSLAVHCASEAFLQLGRLTDLHSFLISDSVLGELFDSNLEHVRTQLAEASVEFERARLELSLLDECETTRRTACQTLSQSCGTHATLKVMTKIKYLLWPDDADCQRGIDDLVDRLQGEKRALP